MKKTKNLKNPRVVTAIVLAAVVVGALFWYLSSTYQVSLFDTNKKRFIIGPSVQMEQQIRTNAGFTSGETSSMEDDQGEDEQGDGFMGGESEGFMGGESEGFMGGESEG